MKARQLDNKRSRRINQIARCIEEERDGDGGGVHSKKLGPVA